MSPPCLFCAIAAGSEPASIVFRDDRLCAFLDRTPLFKGHVLIVPRAHADNLHDLPDIDASGIFQAARRVVRALEEGLQAQGAFVAVNHRVSQSVPHLHLHVVPRTKGDGLRGFFWPRVRYAGDAERDGYAARIAAALPALG